MEYNGLTGVGILIVEDEPLLRKQLAALLHKQGADVRSIDTLLGARKLLADLSFDFVLLDVNLPDGKGTDLFKDKSISDNTAVIVMTGDGGVNGAVEAMRLGALDYLVKPFDPAEVPLVIGRARRARQSARLDEHRRSDSAEQEFFFGKSLAPLKNQLEKILGSDKRMQDRLPPVLIQGETGTGKTTIARWLHHQGPRAKQPLVEVNCPALPENLAESELFGHERGAFTDARTTRMGLFEAAHSGTLFLDELPNLSLPLQAKVLTVIEDQKIRRLGGNKEIHVDVRVIAATNRDLKQLAVEGQFREDLFHRLDLLRLYIPPLRERGEEIGEIVIRGNTVMKGYYRDPEATQHAFRGGWFHTGDLAVIHPDGYVEVKDRAKDIIISGGENVSSLEVERAIYTHPAVLEVAVVSSPHERFGEVPKAFVVLKPDAALTTDALYSHCRDRLAPFKCPRRIEFVDELPKTSTGKIQKYLLRERENASTNGRAI